MICRNAVLLLLILSAPAAHGQGAVRLTDINTQHTGPAASTDRRGEFFGIREMVTWGSRLWFTADDGIHGVELWSTDGSEVGTRRETDLCPGRCAAHPRSLTPFGSRLFFIADDGVHGFEPWITDGTAAGTVMLADVWPGLQDGGTWEARATDTHLLFAGVTPGEGREPWVTDGTPGGTRLLVDLRPGSADSVAHPVGSFAGRNFFVADDGTHGRELWSTDGSAAGTVLLETTPGPSDGVSHLANLGDRTAATATGLFFPATDPDHGSELWRTDGTLAGTLRVADIAPGTASSGVRELSSWQGSVYFFATEGTETELWASGGSAETTQRVFTMTEDPFAGAPRNLTATQLGLFFSRSTGTPAAPELWFSDGTAERSRVLPGTRIEVNLAPLVPAGSGIVFYGFDEAHGTEPWFSDGTEAGTFRLADLAPGPQSSFGIWDYVRGWTRDHLGELGFFWNWSPGADFELWASDGTVAGTRLVKDVNAMASSIRVDPVYYYFGDDPYAPIAPAATPVGLGFLATDGPIDPAHPTPGTTGLELWHVTHEEGEVWQLADLTPGPASSFVQALVSASTALVCSDAQNRLFRSAGVELEDLGLQTREAGLVRLPQTLVASGYALSLDLSSATPLPFSTGGFVSTDGERAFGSSTGYFGKTIAVTDGTPEGTRERSFDLGFFATSPTGVGSGDVAFFGAHQAGEGPEPWIWRTDDSAERLLDIRPGPDSSLAWGFANPNAEWEGWLPKLVRAGPTAFFAADDGTHGHELWATDGTTPGTRLVAEIFPGPRGADLRRLTAVGSRVYFVADDGVHGREIWLSDGTTAGTRLLRDLAPGPGSAVPQELTAIGDFLVFNAWTPEHGRELWISDGTEVGTRRLTDIAPGPLSSSPVTFVAAGGWLYFTANDNVTGDELWRLPLGLLQPGTIFADGFESGNSSAWSTP
ncbi:MAG: hypothetical protein SF066_19150 [Thermoanaerobaculia bacterium]|nr:hypothetical protein [Thermoanaerobaculia bacterium]